MRILLLSSFLPYPLYSGGHIRLYNLIKQLSKKHEIHLVCEKRDYQTKEDIKKVEEYCKKVITVNRKKQWSIKTIIKTGLSSKPFLITGHTNNKMKKEIDDLLSQEKFDLIHVETFYVMQNLPKTSLPVVLVEHNIEYLVYDRFAKTAPLFVRPFLYIDVLKLKFWEERYWRQATRLIAVSEKEKSLMGRRDTVVVPNGVDLKKYPISFGHRRIKYQIAKKRKRILFIGDFRWIENRDAVEWILKEIWPEINGKSKMENGKLILWIVGENIPANIKNFGDKSVIFDEDAPTETSLIYQKADLLIAPIRIGGGTSFKILEAMASGVPVVTTSLGNEGIGAKENEGILVAQSASDFAQKISNLLADAELYTKISENARGFIEEKYDWEKIVKKLESVYESAIKV